MLAELSAKRLQGEIRFKKGALKLMEEGWPYEITRGPCWHWAVERIKAEISEIETEVQRRRQHEAQNLWRERHAMELNDIGVIDPAKRTTEAKVLHSLRAYFEPRVQLECQTFESRQQRSECCIPYLVWTQGCCLHDCLFAEDKEFLPLSAINPPNSWSLYST